MLDVVDGRVEEFGNVVVVQAIDDAATGAGAGDQLERAPQAQLM